MHAFAARVAHSSASGNLVIGACGSPDDHDNSRTAPRRATAGTPRSTRTARAASPLRPRARARVVARARARAVLISGGRRLGAARRAAWRWEGGAVAIGWRLEAREAREATRASLPEPARSTAHSHQAWERNRPWRAPSVERCDTGGRCARAGPQPERHAEPTRPCDRCGRAGRVVQLSRHPFRERRFRWRSAARTTSLTAKTGAPTHDFGTIVSATVTAVPTSPKSAPEAAGMARTRGVRPSPCHVGREARTSEGYPVAPPGGWMWREK
jgi:hypothetical protein